MFNTPSAGEQTLESKLRMAAVMILQLVTSAQFSAEKHVFFVTLSLKVAFHNCTHCDKRKNAALHDLSSKKKTVNSGHRKQRQLTEQS